MTAVPLVLSEREMTPRSTSPAFSNGFEGDVWMERWCGTCRHDDVDRGGNVACPLAGLALGGFTPRQWEDDVEGGLSSRYRCTAYEVEPGERDARA